jgi:hypothetical protein
MLLHLKVLFYLLDDVKGVKLLIEVPQGEGSPLYVIKVH